MFFDYLKVALLMMRAKPVRSALSLFGIYIGVLALAVILAIREGVRGKLENLYKTQGAEVVYIRPAFDPIARNVGRLTFADVSLLKNVPGVQSVLARMIGDDDARSAAGTLRAHLVGVDEHFVSLYRIPVIRGRAFLKEEIEKKQAVCMITADAAQALFPIAEPLGGTIEAKGTLFKIIGVVDWNAETAQRTSLAEVHLLVPTLWLSPRDSDYIPMLEVRVDPEITADQSVALVGDALSHGDPARRRLYFIQAMETAVQKSRDFNEKILAGLLGIAAISLLVGGIGVANVMITSVTERTREIGVRKALGATRAHILAQFLVEASLLSVSGGCLAVLTGLIGVSVVPIFFNLNIPLSLPLPAAAGCVALTVLIGLLAGVYPAGRAASLSPAEALRYE